MNNNHSTSPILGLAAAGGLYYKRIPFDQTNNLIRSAVIRHGIRELDTAPWYGCGKSELDTGRALYGLSLSQKDNIELNQLPVVNVTERVLKCPSTNLSRVVRVLEMNDNNVSSMGLSTDLIKVGTKCGRVTIPKTSCEVLSTQKDTGCSESSNKNSSIVNEAVMSSFTFCQDNYKRPGSTAESRLKAVASRMQEAMHKTSIAQTNAAVEAQQLTRGSSNDPSAELETQKITGTVYLAADETAHLLCVHDCTYDGVLLSFAQSYERVFGPFHAAFGEKILVDPEGFISVCKNESDGASDRAPWFLLDTLRLHDADSDELFAEVVEPTTGGLAAMKALQERGYVRHLSIGSNDAVFTLRYLKHTSIEHITRVPGSEPYFMTNDEDDNNKSKITRVSPFSSILLAGCWNLINAQPEAVELFTFMRHMGVQNPLIMIQMNHSESTQVEINKLGPIELHNAGIFGAGLLWGASVYRYANADVNMMKRRDLLSEILDEEIEETIVNTDSVHINQYRSSPSRYILAGAAITFAGSVNGMPYTEKSGVALNAPMPQIVRLVFGCGSDTELAEAMIANAHRPSEEVVRTALGKFNLTS